MIARDPTTIVSRERGSALPREARDAGDAYPPWPPSFDEILALNDTATGRPVEEVWSKRPAGWEKGAARDTMADVFAAHVIHWARSERLLVSNAPFHRAALNYALTAFASFYPVGVEPDPAAPDWRVCAELIARYMLLVAAGDEGIFDLKHEGEGIDERRVRLETSARFICAAIHGAAAVPTPCAQSATLLAAIARGWQDILAPLAGRAHPALIIDWRQALEGLYEASVKEHDVEIVDGTLVRSLVGDNAIVEGAAEAIMARYGARVPRVFQPRLRALVDAVAAEPQRAQELRMVLYLVDANNTIGAGLLFRTAALIARADEVTAAHVDALDAVAEILNYRIRLSNDLSELFTLDGRDRDGKETSCSMLVPNGVDEAARRAAIADAATVAQRVVVWLDGALASAIDGLARCWPWMAALVRRATFMGKRTYEIGHYKTLTRAQMSTIFDEMERRVARP